MCAAYLYVPSGNVRAGVIDETWALSWRRRLTATGTRRSRPRPLWRTQGKHFTKTVSKALSCEGIDVFGIGSRAAVACTATEQVDIRALKLRELEIVNLRFFVVPNCRGIDALQMREFLRI
jgi:hypothetical protein